MTTDPKIRFYAGAPLTTPDGHAIGMLCVNDRVPRKLTDAQKEGLRALARQAVAQLELRQQLAELERTRQQLLDASRQAGMMAEVATTVLHNVGNVLNSVTVSSAVISEKIRKSKAPNLAKIAELIQEHQHDLAGFLTQDPKGRQVAGYVVNLAQHLSEEQAELLRELKCLNNNIEHIKEIVVMQQGYARTAGKAELLPVVGLIEDALRLNEGSLAHQEVEVVREYADMPLVLIEKHKMLQILVNLIRNAKHALTDTGRNGDKRLILRVSTNGGNTVDVSVIDNGIGIPSENVARMFEYGFTTRQEWPRIRTAWRGAGGPRVGWKVECA